jgi:YbgC/YbaW family acyl-CoA thioester hydrolase
MFFDTDCGGVVHNIAYLRFVEIARTLLAEELGLPLATMAETQKYPVVVRTEIDYRRGAKLGDRLWWRDGWISSSAFASGAVSKSCGHAMARSSPNVVRCWPW